MSVLCSPQCLDARRPRSWDLHRSMELAFEGRGAGKANLAEQCCYWDYTPPLPKGAMLPYKHLLARSHILFPRF